MRTPQSAETMIELERRLKHRVGRHDLVQRNILPPLSLPTAPKLFTQTQQLQRAKNADNLQKKLRNRPDRSDLRQLNILPDIHINIDPGLQAKQVQLLKSRKVDTLNEKLANRPGPIQLMKDRILEPDLAEVVEDEAFEALGPENDQNQDIPAIALQRTPSESVRNIPTQQRHSIATSAPSTTQLNIGSMSPSKEMMSPLASLEPQRRKMSDSSLSPASSPNDGYNEDSRSPPVASPRGFNSSYPPLNPAHTAMMSSGPGKAPSPSQTRKKQQKSQKYRKLRYHEYVPPTKNTPKGGKQTPKTPPKSNSPYDLLLQQQQLFLHLQVLHQNGTMPKMPDIGLSKEQKNLALAAAKAGRLPSAGDMSLHMSKQLSNGPHLPQIISIETPNKQNISNIRFDDLKVQDLKAACKELGMIVSGKKAELVERLLDVNKRLLPARALPDTSKDNRRHAFSVGANSSVDSQLSGSSPPSPTNSPVFTYPSDQHNGILQHSQTYSTMKTHGSNPQPMRMESVPTMFPEVFPASTLQQKFEEMLQQQKMNYITQKGSIKNLAPCPDLNELVAIKLPSYHQQAPPTYQQSVNHKGTKGTVQHRASEPKLQLQVGASGDLSPRSLPSSPITNDAMLNEFSEDPNTNTTSTTPSSLATTTNGVLTGAHGNDAFLIPSMNMTTSIECSMANNIAMGTAAMYTGHIGDVSMRPSRASVPESMPESMHVHPSHPPSYEISCQRTISLPGPHPPMGHMQGGPSFNGEVLHNNDNMMMDIDIPMDTEENNFSDLFDILKADRTGFSGTQPQSLPLPLPHSSHPHSSHPHNMSYTSPTKLGHRQDSLQADSIMLGAQSKSLTGSDLCLSIPTGQDNTRNTYNMGDNVMLGNELGWLDLENAGTNLGFSTGFENMGSHSNPGSLPHDQFQMQFMDENGGNNFMKVSNPSLNGIVNPSNDIGPFLGSGLQSGLLVQSDEKTLLELGLSS